MIAITVEKDMDWKQAVVPTLTKPSTAAPTPAPPSPPPSSAQPAAPAGAKPPPSGQYIFLLLIYLYNYITSKVVTIYLFF